MNNATSNKQNATTYGKLDHGDDEPYVARNLVHVQIQKFMDEYQKRLVGRLTTNALALNPIKTETNPPQIPHQTSMHSAKPQMSTARQDRERLHKIWLATKPPQKLSVSI
jgi:hypothetical protein